MSITALVVGYGSAGQRHANNLFELGHEVIIVESDKYNMERATVDHKTYSSIEDVKEHIDIAFVCTPTESHISIAQKCIELEGLKGIFCEKPLSFSMEGVENLVNMCKKNNIKLMVAENLRFNRGIELVKILLDNNSIGKIFASNYFFGSCLKDWRPTTDYKSSYSSKENGGILRDDIHASALMLHLFGSVNKSIGILHNTHTLKIAEDDIADYILQHNNGIISHIHSNYLLPFYYRTLEIYGLEGAIQFDYVDQIVNLRTKNLDMWRTFDCSCDANDMYLKQLQYYISCIDNNTEPYHNGISALKIIDNLKK